MFNFPRKEYGRIFVEKESDIEAVKEIIRKMDDFEYKYLPDDFIAVFTPEKYKRNAENGKRYWFVRLVYTHKFDSLDLNEFQARCWIAGIKVFCVMDGQDGFIVYEGKKDGLD